MLAGLAFSLRLAVGLVLTTATVAKLRSYPAFEATVAELTSSRRLARLAAPTFLAAEATAGVFLASGIEWRLGNELALGVLGVLVLVSTFALATRRQIPCSCFGASERALGRGTLPLALSLFGAQAVYVVVLLGDSDRARPPLEDVPVAISISCLLIVSARWLGALTTLVEVITHRRRLARADHAYR